MQKYPSFPAGFTLIELSIVLTIIGLIVGGILVGQNLINAAAVRAQISQIEKYQTAVNTFRNKYNALPGDMNSQTAAQFGFARRGSPVQGYTAGMGDGNGLIEGSYNSGCGNCNNGSQALGEPSLFWNDLTYANGMNIGLIEGSFSITSTLSSWPATAFPNPSISPPAIDAWLPEGKIGQGNYVYVWSVNGVNYFGLSAIYKYAMSSNAGLTVAQAYAIDSKVDDGLPQSGGVQAFYIPTSYWAWAMNSFQTHGYGGASPGTAANGSSTSCYDNGGNANNLMQYSVSQKTSNLNCALSFRFQ